MTKKTYTDAARKHAVREFMFSYFKFSKIVGLAGPDINEYIKWCRARGFTDFEIFESNPKVVLNQLSKIDKSENITLKFDDILKAQVKDNRTFYDLDYCATVRYLTGHIQKFKNNFIMTFSLRGVSKKETLDTFFETRNEQIVSKLEIETPIKHTIYKTNKNNNYLYAAYLDTSPMCCIAKI